MEDCEDHLQVPPSLSAYYYGVYPSSGRPGSQQSFDDLSHSQIWAKQHSLAGEFISSSSNFLTFVILHKNREQQPDNLNLPPHHHLWSKESKRQIKITLVINIIRVIMNQLQSFQCLTPVYYSDLNTASITSGEIGSHIWSGREQPHSQLEEKYLENKPIVLLIL